MGNCNVTILNNQVNNNIIKLYNLYNDKSLFFNNSHNSFSELCKQVYIKDLNLQNKKIKLLNHKIKRLKSMKLDDYIRNKKILNDENKIDKDHFIKSLSIFDNNELEELLINTKKIIFLELKKEFD